MPRKPVLTLGELQKIIAELPNTYDCRARGPYYRVAISPRLPVYLAYEAAIRDMAVDIHTIEFRLESTEVCGKPATAWFYGDVLVKVTL